MILDKMERASRSSSVYSSQRNSRIDLKEALKELDLYYWKTHQDFLHEFNKRHAPRRDASPTAVDCSAEKRGRSRRPSFKRGLSLGLDSNKEQEPPLPGNIVISPTHLAATPSFRSKSWGPPRRSAKQQRVPSPTPSFHGPSEYLHNEDTRAKLRMYFNDPDKFDEALALGFPSVMPTPQVKESPVIPQAPKTPTRGRNLGLDVHRFMRGDIISWIDSSEGQASPFEESKSEREVEKFARELAIENAVPTTSEEHYERDFDISDFENAIDDSQDDRRTPSPISPITPPADEHLPLALVAKPSLSRRTFSETIPDAKPLTEIVRSKSHRKRKAPNTHGLASKSEVDLRQSLTAMVRTAPPLPAKPDPIVIPSDIPTSSSISPVSPVSRDSKESMGYFNVSAMSSIQPSPIHSRNTSQQEPAAYAFLNDTHQTKSNKHHDGLRVSAKKELPPLPLVIPPKDPSRGHRSHKSQDESRGTQRRRARTSHGNHDPLHNPYKYDSPAAYMAPRSPPATPVAAPRQMTLRMTLTRPELRATDEEIYGRSRSKTEPPVRQYAPKQGKAAPQKPLQDRQDGSQAQLFPFSDQPETPKTPRNVYPQTGPTATEPISPDGFAQSEDLLDAEYESIKKTRDEVLDRKAIKREEIKSKEQKLLDRLSEQKLLDRSIERKLSLKQALATEPPPGFLNTKREYTKPTEPDPKGKVDAGRREPRKLRKVKTEGMVIEHTTFDQSQNKTISPDATSPAMIFSAPPMTVQESALHARAPPPVRTNHEFLAGAEYLRSEEDILAPLRSAPPLQGDFRGVYALGSSPSFGEGARENRRSLWKKMSMIGMKRGPSVVWP